jgi:hypothetical protein
MQKIWQFVEAAALTHNEALEGYNVGASKHWSFKRI